MDVKLAPTPKTKRVSMEVERRYGEECLGVGSTDLFIAVGDSCKLEVL